MSDLIERAERVAGLSTGEHERLIRELVEALRANKVAGDQHRKPVRAGVRLSTSDYTGPGSAVRLLGVLAKVVEAIPEEHRATADMDWTHYETFAYSNVCYWRPETFEETAAREKFDAEIAERTRKHELAELARLRAKHPDAPP